MPLASSERLLLLPVDPAGQYHLAFHREVLHELVRLFDLAIAADHQFRIRMIFSYAGESRYEVEGSLAGSDQTEEEKVMRLPQLRICGGEHKYIIRNHNDTRRWRDPLTNSRQLSESTMTRVAFSR